MRFVLNNGEMVLQKPVNIVEKMNEALPVASRHHTLINKSKNFLTNTSLSVAPLPLVLATVPVGSTGVFWDAFLQYIFPWILDIGKVYCAIRIAQAFWQERRGGRDEQSGVQAMLTHGKWYLALWLLPWGVELIDGIGETMFSNLRDNPINLPTSGSGVK